MTDQQPQQERRSINRRQNSDRRQYLRWEPGKKERRRGWGRRKEDGLQGYWQD
ncbi:MULTISPECIES: hypothetical protein [unclassified Ferrimonas]|uniref:hypothetical protein n=1 Tax=unclassified Ferrimonas TaxID=2620587 RepID=UPI0025736BB3|nr:hypothetical protein [Ferrimonas sp. YFM]